MALDTVTKEWRPPEGRTPSPRARECTPNEAGTAVAIVRQNFFSAQVGASAAS